MVGNLIFKLTSLINELEEAGFLLAAAQASTALDYLQEYARSDMENSQKNEHLKQIISRDKL